MLRGALNIAWGYRVTLFEACKNQVLILLFLVTLSEGRYFVVLISQAIPNVP